MVRIYDPFRVVLNSMRFYRGLAPTAIQVYPLRGYGRNPPLR